MSASRGWGKIAGIGMVMRNRIGRRCFVVGAAAALAGLSGCGWLGRRGDDRMVNAPKGPEGPPRRPDEMPPPQAAPLPSVQAAPLAAPPRR